MGCQGTLRDGERTVNVEFDVQVSRFGKIGFKILPRPVTAEIFWLLDLGRSPGRFAKAFGLNGASQDDRVVRSDTLYLTGHELSGGTVGLTGKIDHLTTEPAGAQEYPSAAGCVISFNIGGIRGFSQQQAETPCGQVTFAAMPRADTEDEISGHLVIQASEKEIRSVADWTAECESECRRILDVLSMVEGMYFTACIRSLCQGNTWIRSDFWDRGPSGVFPEPLWYSLDLEPFFKLGVSSYTKDLRETRGFDVAIESFFAHSSYLEVKLTTVQATLEYLVSCFERVRGLRGSVVEKTDFQEYVRPKLEEAIDAAIEVLGAHVEVTTIEQAKELFNARVGGLNALTLRERLFRMLNTDGVPYEGLEDAIKQAIAARGSIVHGAKASARQIAEYVRHVAVLREVVKRIFLTLLNYRGRYITFLNGVADADFPPTAPTTVIA